MKEMGPQKLSPTLIPQYSYINSALELPGLFIISNNYYPNLKIMQLGRIYLPEEKTNECQLEVENTTKDKSTESGESAEESATQEAARV